MNGEQEEMAEEIGRRLTGWNCFTMSLWGGLAFQPADNIFKLLSASVKDSSLLLRFRQYGGDECELQLWEPASLSITDGGDLVVKTVKRLRWRDSPPTDAPTRKHSDIAVELGFSRWPT